MLSRHNIRIKVLQTLYASLQNEGIDQKEALAIYRESVDESFRLFILNLLYLQRVAEYAKIDLQIKSTKYIHREEDRKASIKLYDNIILDSLRQNKTYQTFIEDQKLERLVDDNLVRNLYKEFYESEYYTTYLKMNNPPIKEQQYCLVNLYKLMLDNEPYLEHLEDVSPVSEDDQSLVFGALKRTIRGLPADDFFKSQSPNDEFVDDFGAQLLVHVLAFKEDDQARIVEKLKNWKEDRVAVLDMIILKMAFCEFIHFRSIPTKVTINEYVSIAKDYSTDKSKRFVNGLLDRLMNDLNKNGLIVKEGRGLKDN